MPKKRIQVSCPNCRTPQAIEAQQVFDAQAEPESKQAMLTGAPNLLRCPHCGYQGPVHMPVVYHDSEKGLLLTHVPQELNLPMHEQERVVGPLIKQVVDGLPAEKRRAYLFQPKTMLTMQTMVETILEADGVTREMIAAQQDRVQLLQRLANLTSDDAIVEVARQEDAKIDREFFSILSMLVSNALSGGDEALARRLLEVQQKILPVTTYGQEIQKQNEEVQEAARELQALGEEITRDDLVDLVVKAPTDIRLRAYVSLARAGMDYEFFQKLSARIDRARPDARGRLAEMREKLLDLTRQFDAQQAEQAEQMKQLLEALLEEEAPQEILAQNPDLVNDLFLSVLEEALEKARENGDLERGGKLQSIVDAIEQLAATPPEVEWINRLVVAGDDAARRAVLDSIPPDQLSGVVEMLTNVLPQVEASGDEATLAALRAAHRMALGRSMRMQLRKSA